MSTRSFSPSFGRTQAKKRKLSSTSVYQLPNKIKPKLIVFDLDATLWHPELYQLGSMVRAHKEIVLHAGAIDALKQLYSWRGECQGAVASRTDRTKLAESLLHEFEAVPGVKAAQVLPYREIYTGSKRRHFRNLREKTGIPYSDMIFFDDWTLNLDEVSQLGVLGIHTPRGLTHELWAGGLWAYAQIKESAYATTTDFPPHLSGSLVLTPAEVRKALSIKSNTT